MKLFFKNAYGTVGGKGSIVLFFLYDWGQEVYSSFGPHFKKAISKAATKIYTKVEK